VAPRGDSGFAKRLERPRDIRYRFLNSPHCEQFWTVPAPAPVQSYPREDGLVYKLVVYPPKESFFNLMSMEGE
jgi:hypothetical protein